jgi:protein TonB
MLTVIIFVAALITLISFDGTWSSVLQSARNNIVFSGRNMDYGAYAMRREYHRNLLFALLISSLSIGGICSALFFASSSTEMPIQYDPGEIESFPPLIPDDQKPDEKPDEKPKPQRKLTSSVENRTVEVVDNGPTVNPSTQVDKLDKPTGTVDIEGDGPAMPPSDGDGNSDVPDPLVIPDRSIWVSSMPLFPGGEKAMREYLSRNISYSERDRNEGRQGIIWITFVVLKNGKIGEVAVERGIPGGDELGRRCVAAVQKMPTWTPGMIGDHPVEYKHRIPIKFEIRKN